MVLARKDAGLPDDDTLTLQCSEYTEDVEHGHVCLGNDPEALPYWESRG
jgi:hypothetical protein